MNLVQPIRNKKQISDMLYILKNSSDRDYMMFNVGIGIGIRISDILPLKKSDVAYDHLYIKEKKTGKRKRQLIPPQLRKELNQYVSGMKEDDYLFASRQTDRLGRKKPIDRSTAYRILKRAAKEVGIKEFGCHSTRKTFGYFFYQETKDVAMLQKMFNHDSQDVTLRYIGITQDSEDEAMIRFGNSFLNTI